MLAGTGKSRCNDDVRDLKWIGLLLFLLVVPAMASEPLYENHFEKTPVGEEPDWDSHLILNGQFTIQKQEDNPVLHLPGAPLDTYGILLGPTRPTNLTIQARANGDKSGRRYPVFGVGLNGNSGLKLQVEPARRAVTLRLGQEVVKEVPFAWVPKVWTHFELTYQVGKDGKGKVVGRVWQASKETSACEMEWTPTEPPPNGRPALWAAPYSGIDILFDDVLVLDATPE